MHCSLISAIFCTFINLLVHGHERKTAAAGVATARGYPKAEKVGFHLADEFCFSTAVRDEQTEQLIQRSHEYPLCHGLSQQLGSGNDDGAVRRKCNYLQHTHNFRFTCSATGS